MFFSELFLHTVILYIDKIAPKNFSLFYYLSFTKINSYTSFTLMTAQMMSILKVALTTILLFQLDFSLLSIMIMKGPKKSILIEAK